MPVKSKRSVYIFKFHLTKVIVITMNGSKFVWPTRLSVGLMLFMAAFACYLLRVNMSMIIIAMIQPKNVTANASANISLPNVSD